MAFIEDAGRVAETTTTTGSGAVSVAGAVASYQRFSAKLSVSDTFPGAIVASDGTWQEGIFTYSALNQITFTTILDGSSGTSPITLPAGTHTVFAGFLGMGKTIVNAPGKTTPVGADTLALVDSADSNRLKSVSITNLAPALKGGGALASGSVTLTSASSAVQKLTFTSFGQTVTLPDATTMQKGSPLFMLHNASEFPGRVIDSTGVMRGVLPAQRVATIGLADNSTAAGAWDCVGCELIGVTAQLDAQSVSVGGGSFVAFVIDLDASRQLFLFGDTSVYAVCYNKSTNTWGTPVLVRSSIIDTDFSMYSGIKSATDQVLVTSVASLTAFQAVVLSISTLTITVNTPASQTLAGTGHVLGAPILVGTGWVVPYTRDTTTVGIRAVTISGTTPTVGAETALTSGGSTLPHLYASSSVVLCLGPNADSATTIYVKPFTLSGTTLTAGTAQTVGASTTSNIRSLVFGTRWLFLYNDASVVNASLVSISAGNATVSTVTSIIAANAVPGTCDAIICNSKVVVSSPSVSSVVGYFQILTDTAGTLSKGTAFQCIDSTNGASAVSASGTSCRFANTAQSFSVSASGASPVVTVTGGGSGPKLNGYFVQTDAFGCTRVQPQVFSPGNLIFSGANALGFSASVDYLLIPVAGPAGNFAITSSTVVASTAPTTMRNSTTEFWLMGSTGPSGLTATLQRIEAAQP